ERDGRLIPLTRIHAGRRIPRRRPPAGRNRERGGNLNGTGPGARWVDLDHGHPGMAQGVRAPGGPPGGPGRVRLPGRPGPRTGPAVCPELSAQDPARLGGPASLVVVGGRLVYRAGRPDHSGRQTLPPPPDRTL